MLGRRSLPSHHSSEMKLPSLNLDPLLQVSKVHLPFQLDLLFDCFSAFLLFFRYLKLSRVLISYFEWICIVQPTMWSLTQRYPENLLLLVCFPASQLFNLFSGGNQVSSFIKHCCWRIPDFWVEFSFQTP